MVEMTHEQAMALGVKWQQDHNDMTLDDFLDSVQPTFGCDGAVTVKWCRMWLCVERDGYCHT
jgi:hypothetical protein